MNKRFLIILTFVLLSMQVYSQNIDAKLGENGVFTIKNSTGTPILQVTGAEGLINFSGALHLSMTGDYSSGVIYKGSTRFLHDKGIDNVFLGMNSGNFSLETSATGNTAVGSGTLQELSYGYENSAFGLLALQGNTSGNYNSAFGSHSLTPNTTGYMNSAYGYSSLRSNTEGYNNSAFGTGALFANMTGYHNSAFGYGAGNSITNGSNLTLLGHNAQPSSPSATNQVTLGDNQVTTIRANTTTITSLSDARDKKNIKDLSLGLEFLMKVKTREFYWDKREWYEDGIADGSRMENKPTAGFIAQELDQLQSDATAEWLKLVLKDNQDKYEATAGNLFPVLVKAVQDLKIEKDSEIALLKSENAQLKKDLDSLKELQLRLVRLESVIMNSEVKFSSNLAE
jgi:trimeric autotransporter adhesin